MNPIKLLLQTTIPYSEDDWSIERFSLLADYIKSLNRVEGEPLAEVTTRNKESKDGRDDELLSHLDESDFDELWLFAVDAGDGLTTNDCAGITRFRRRGGGILATRDHQDLGSSICTLGGIGPAHFFHSRNLDPDPSRHTRDDQVTTKISWPNYYSGRNGDYQEVVVPEPVHDLMKAAGMDRVIRYFPAHPHEGGVGVPQDEKNARVIAVGKSQSTGNDFNLIVAFESDPASGAGRAIAESSFHHLVDYNWDISKGCPSFVEEAPGNEVELDPSKLNDIKYYVRNAVVWLAEREMV